MKEHGVKEVLPREYKLAIKDTIKENLVKMAKEMVKANLFGWMAKDIRVNGEVDWRMVQEYGNLVRVIAILVNGSKVKFKDMEYI